MKYVFDTGVFIDIFRHYYRDQFPSFWEQFDSAVRDEKGTYRRGKCSRSWSEVPTAAVRLEHRDLHLRQILQSCLYPRLNFRPI